MLVRGSSWNGRRVLVTGHTGFKGGWLSLWLRELGAQVSGFALPAPTDPSLFEQVRLRELVSHIEGDVRDLGALQQAIVETQPEVIFHLAAQPLVRYSYANPVETYATNVMGTVHVLEAARHAQSVRAVICVTTDKCYENREWVWPYRETDPMGGHDPYSSSKGAAELAIAGYRRSYPQGPKIASVRAGNVIGGGDWAPDRLVPDIVRALLAGELPLIRNPGSIRPWQHVLDALSGYLLLAQRLLEGRDELATAWNFGPMDDDARPVGWIVEQMLRAWGSDSGWVRPDAERLHEAVQLRLDSSKSRAELGWRPAFSLEDALDKVVEWHSRVHGGADAREVSIDQLQDYLKGSELTMSEAQWA
jgi:CDP-glucose 4,6-dehydratase